MDQHLIAKTAVGYMRTSSSVNSGDKGSQARQRAAIKGYAKSQGLRVVKWFYDEGISGKMPIQDRPEFSSMLDYMYSNGARTILLESPARLARDVMIQELAFLKLQEKGIQLVPVNAPEFFSGDDEDGMRKLIRTILGGISAFERDGVVHKLKVARDRKSAELGRRVEGRKAVPPEVVKAAKKLNWRNPKTHKRRSLREIAKELGKLGYLGPSGEAYHAGSIKAMLERK